MAYIKARPTIYKGIRMRSRLEAAHARYLDRTGWEGYWQYEPNAYSSEQGEYLPDFVLDGEAGVLDGNGYFNYHGFVQFFIEVKPPNADHYQALKRMHIIRESLPDSRLYVETSDDYETWRRVGYCWPNSGCDYCGHKT